MLEVKGPSPLPTTILHLLIQQKFLLLFKEKTSTSRAQFRMLCCLLPVQRQYTLDSRYLTLLCDNLKNRMFLQKIFKNHSGMMSITGKT
jgi:hypothetical protein